MRYAVVAIVLSAGLLWDTVANGSHYRLMAMRLVSEALRSLGF